jgi:hypothetical protein
MEMIMTGKGAGHEVRLQFAPDGRAADSDVRQVKLSAKTISFLATLADRPYQFTGERRNNQWEGTLSATGSPSDRGTWRLALVDLIDVADKPRIMPFTGRINSRLQRREVRLRGLNPFVRSLSEVSIKNAVANLEEPLPTATGRYSTGRTTFHRVDKTRPELETRAPEDPRELLVYVFYPSEVNKTTERAPYIPDSEVMRGVWENELTDRLKRMRAHSREEVAPVKGRERLPVVIFAPGNG